MPLNNLSQLERNLLDALVEQGPITISLDNAAQTAAAFGTNSQGLAAAKNTLVANGYVTQQSDVFTGGDVVMTATDLAVTDIEAVKKKAKKPWWRFW